MRDFFHKHSRYFSTIYNTVAFIAAVYGVITWFGVIFGAINENSGFNKVIAVVAATVIHWLGIGLNAVIASISAMILFFIPYLIIRGLVKSKRVTLN